MRKLTKNELKRNKIYDTIANIEFEDYEVIGNVKQGLLIRDKDDGQDVVLKTILKKEKVNFDDEKLERPIENVEKENTKSE